jgi:hypothetical protein
MEHNFVPLLSISKFKTGFTIFRQKAFIGLESFAKADLV